MSGPSETFEASLNKWKNERIQPLGSQGIEQNERDYVISERARELTALCREHGTYAELVNTAETFGGIENFVRHLIQVSDAQGTTLRPTAHEEQTIERVFLHQPKGSVAAYVSRKANSRDSLSLLYRTAEAFAATFGSGTV